MNGRIQDVEYFVDTRTWSPKSMSMRAVLVLLAQGMYVYVVDHITKVRVGRFILTSKGYAYIRCAKR